MPNPRLNKDQLNQAREFLNKIRNKINELSNKNPELIFAFRRKIYKELMYDERGTPYQRKRLKVLMCGKQKNRCALCNTILKLKESELDRFEAIHGYFESNVRLVHHDCHRKDQSEKNHTDTSK